MLQVSRKAPESPPNSEILNGPATLDRPRLPPFRTLWPWSPPNRRRRRNRLQSPAEIMNQAERHNRHRLQRRAPEQSAIQPLNYIWNINDANVHRWFYYPP